MAGFITRQKALGNRVVIRNSARFDGDLELGLGTQAVERVYVTEVSMRVMSAYLEAGVPVDVLSAGPKPIPTLPDLRAQKPEPEPEPELEPERLHELEPEEYPEPEPTSEDPDLPPRYALKETPGGWWKPMLDGVKVTRAFRGKDAEEKARQAAWDHFMEVSDGRPS